MKHYPGGFSALVRDIRHLNHDFDGPASVVIWDDGSTIYTAAVESYDTEFQYGCEKLRGDGLRIDAPAIARRLLSDWRSGTHTWEMTQP